MTFASHQLAELGARVRRCLEERPADFAAIAQAIADTIWDAFPERTPPTLALIQVFRLRQRVPVLVASRGLEPAWNDVAQARVTHAATWLDALPLAAGNLEPDVFFVADAVDSPHVPAQDELVLRYGVRSVVACGTPLPGDGAVAIVILSRAIMTADVAATFGTVATNAALALTRATDLGAGAEATFAFRAERLERLLRLQEYQFLKGAALLARESEEIRGRVAALERDLADATAAGAERQQRTQRAMLNVIEDLREARDRLEQRVVERTHALAHSNEELRSSNAELEQFAYVASHDLQEPLRTIAGYLQLLRERYGDRIDADGHEFVSYAIGGAQRMQELIEALLLYSRISRAPIDTSVVPLGVALDDALLALQRSLTESRAEVVRAPLPAIRGDEVLLRQVFQNLLSNAIKFAGTQPPRIEIRSEQAAGTVTIRVTDHGVGFDPKYSEIVFKVFRRLQRKLPGTGIGLAICKRIVERHGGTIRAEATPGAGATFILTFPIADVPS